MLTTNLCLLNDFQSWIPPRCPSLVTAPVSTSGGVQDGASATTDDDEAFVDEIITFA